MDQLDDISGDISARMSRLHNVFLERNAIYGNNFYMVGDVLHALFPEGVPPLRTAEEHARFDLLSMIVGKLTRYVKSFGSGGHEDSLDDLSVYCAILASLDAGLRARSTASAATPRPEGPKPMNGERVTIVGSEITRRAPPRMFDATPYQEI